MKGEERINPRHGEIRKVLRIVGPIIAGIGVLLIVVSLVSFFSAFGTFERPQYMWCAFLGMPLLFVGVTLSMLGFMGAVMRYQAGEAAPVAKDTFNYMAGETRGGVRTMASALGEGLSEGMRGGHSLVCPRCRHANDADAKFCDECGSRLARVCAACGEANDHDAAFCDKCGERLNA